MEGKRKKKVQRKSFKVGLIDGIMAEGLGPEGEMKCCVTAHLAAGELGRPHADLSLERMHLQKTSSAGFECTLLPLRGNKSMFLKPLAVQKSPTMVHRGLHTEAWWWCEDPAVPCAAPLLWLQQGQHQPAKPLRAQLQPRCLLSWLAARRQFN